MAQKKFSQLPPDSGPTTNDSIPIYDADTVLTKRSTISDLITLFFNNIPSGAGSPITRYDEAFYDFVSNGLVWSGDSYAVNRNASMTAGVIYLNGRRISISAVSARTFTASKDTYIDVLDNLDGTGTLVYTEVANNAASPTLAANSLRIGIIITAATTIAAVGSVNQGQENKVLPIVSSIPYAVTDSIGNLICPRDPNRKLLGYRQILADATSTTSGANGAQITGLTCPVDIPLGRKVRVSVAGAALTVATSGTPQLQIWEGVVGSGAQLAIANGPIANNFAPAYCERVYTPTTALLTFNASFRSTGGNTATLTATSNSPASIKVELI